MATSHTFYYPLQRFWFSVSAIFDTKVIWKVVKIALNQLDDIPYLLVYKSTFL